MPAKKKEVKVADLKPTKDATGGRNVAASKVTPKAHKASNTAKSKIGK